MQAFRLPGRIIQNGRAASRLVAAQSPTSSYDVNPDSGLFGAAGLSIPGAGAGREPAYGRSQPCDRQEKPCTNP
jgi:hypothetical protein